MGSPFEGGQGDVCIYFPKQNPNYQTLTKNISYRTKILTVLCIA